MNLTIFLQDDTDAWIDITRWVVVQDLPDWIRTSVKGDGFFAWTMEPIKFSMFKLEYIGPNIERNRRLRIIRANIDLPVVDGFIDEITNEFEVCPSITVQPVGVLAKDTMAGTLQDNNSYIFDTRGGGQGYPLASTIALLLSSLHHNMPSSYPDVYFDSVITMGENIVTAFYGEVLHSWFEGPRLPPYEEQYFYLEALFSIRIRNGIYYAFRARVMPVGPPGDQDLDIVHYNARRINELTYGNEIIVQPSELYLYNEVTTEDGDLSQIDIDAWAADSGINIEYQLSSVQIGSSFWVLLLSTDRYYFVWFRNVFVNHNIAAVLHDWTVAEVLKLWAILTNHWLAFDGVHLFFLARADAREDIEIPNDQIKSKKQKRKKYENINLDIPKLKITDDGIEDYGVGLSENHISALRRYYRLLWEGNYIESELQVGEYPDALDLSLLGKDPTYGHLMQLNYSTQYKRLQVVSVKEDV